MWDMVICYHFLSPLAELFHIMQPDPYIQFLENWIPGIGEDTKLHDQLHVHFDLDLALMMRQDF